MCVSPSLHMKFLSICFLHWEHQVLKYVFLSSEKSLGEKSTSRGQERSEIVQQYQGLEVCPDAKILLPVLMSNLTSAQRAFKNCYMKIQYVWRLNLHFLLEDRATRTSNEFPFNLPFSCTKLEIMMWQSCISNNIRALPQEKDLPLQELRKTKNSNRPRPWLSHPSQPRNVLFPQQADWVLQRRPVSVL